jgi:hypothetical protein
VAFEDALEHVAVPRVTVEQVGWIEGEPEEDRDRPGIPFACVLFMPLGPEQSASRGARVVKRPTLLCSYLDHDGNVVSLSPKDKLDVTAPKLTGPDPVRWQIDGSVQPFGPPGDETIGSQVILKRVDE